MITTTTPTYTAQNTKLFQYAGSKAKYKSKFNDLHSQIEIKKVNTYIEAFGGTLASMFHNLEHINADRIIINDINPRLINLYKQIQTNPQEVIDIFTLIEETFQSHIPKRFQSKSLIKDKPLREKYLGHLRDFYNSARDFYNISNFNTAENAGTLLFLLQHNFNGVYGEAKKTGYFNISFNWNMKTINTEKIIENLMNLHYFFTQNNVIIENLDTNNLIEKYSENNDTMIYLDPPYVNSDISYSSEQTTDFNTVKSHFELLESCNVFDYVIYSNNYNEAINNKMSINIEFTRTNNIAQNKQSKSKNEILGFIDNVLIVMPTVQELLHEQELQKLVLMPNVHELLSYQSANVSNNTYDDLHELKVA